MVDVSDDRAVVGKPAQLVGMPRLDTPCPAHAKREDPR